MKYNPRRNYLHPVLRPFSNDYPDGTLVTELEVDPSPEVVTVAVNFQVNEPSIQEEIKNGGAICAAMLYCGPTLYREMLRAGKGSVRAEAAIPAYMLRGEVLVHPAIFATADLNYHAPTVHEEYKVSKIEIGQWNPMAVDRYWQFQVRPAERNTKGIFNLEIDKELPDGEFDIKCEINEKYVSITANEETRAKLKQLGAQEQDNWELKSRQSINGVHERPGMCSGGSQEFVRRRSSSRGWLGPVHQGQHEAVKHRYWEPRERRNSHVVPSSSIASQ